MSQDDIRQFFFNSSLRMILGYIIPLYTLIPLFAKEQLFDSYELVFLYARICQMLYYPIHIRIVNYMPINL